MAKILVIDDDVDVRTAITDVLKFEGYDVENAGDGGKALDLIRETEYDLIVLDLRLPDMDGIEILRIVKNASPKTQIILLTGKGTLDSAIEGIRLGVHDYLLKPVRPEHLLESVANGLLRLRSYEAKMNSVSSSPEVAVKPTPPGDRNIRTEIFPLREGAVADFSLRTVTWKDVSINLTPNEARLLRFFLEHPGQVLTPEELVSNAQGYQVDEKDAPELLRPLLSRLRAKLSAIPDAETWIANIRGAGYLFERRSQKSPPRYNDGNV